MASYRGMEFEADGINFRLDRTAVKTMTKSAAPKGFPHLVLAAAKDSTTMRLNTVRTYTGFSITFTI